MDHLFEVIVYHFSDGSYIVGYGVTFEDDLREVVALSGHPTRACRSSQEWIHEMANEDLVMVTKK